ncbi:hypothetical protein [Hyphococcus sp.]|uniref:hypothetical protein n=1 Tax=Hyphococcus sp. TaxID=2038636 RepID=UPI003CCBAA74
MIEKLGLAALVVLIASETFAVSEAILWSLASMLHLGGSFAVLVVSLLLGSAAGFGIFKLARASAQEDAQ